MKVSRTAAPGMAWRVVLASTAVWVLAACADPNGPGGLVPVELPPLEELEPGVQTQLRDGFARLSRDAEQPTDLAAEYGRFGMLCHAYNLLPSARASYLNAEALDPEEFRWPYLLGLSERLAGRTEEAADSLLRAVEINPGHVPAWVHLGELVFEQGDTQGAESHFRRALELDESCAAAEVGLGRAALNTGNPAAAVGHFERALGIQPHASSIRYQLGLAHRELGHLDQAASYLAQRGEGKVTMPDPVLAEVYSQVESARMLIDRGRGAASAGRYQLAAEALTEAVERNPREPAAYLLLGAVMDALDRRDLSIDHYSRVLQLEPDNPRAHYGLGLVYGREGADETAAEHFRQALSLDPALWQAGLELGKALERSGLPREALEAYDRLLDARPLHAQGRLRRALCLIRLGDHVAARQQLEEDARAFPDEPAFSHLLARLLAASPDPTVRDGSAAIGLVQSLSEMLADTTFAETIAMALAEVGDFEQAATWQRRALEVASSSGRDDLAERMRDRLRSYEAGVPCREPWPDDDPLFNPAPAAARVERGEPEREG